MIDDDDNDDSSINNNYFEFTTSSYMIDDKMSTCCNELQATLRKKTNDDQFLNFLYRMNDFFYLVSLVLQIEDAYCVN